MTLGQSGPSREADVTKHGAGDDEQSDRTRALARKRLLARVRTEVIPGLEELVDHAGDPAQLIALADHHSRRLRAELERPDHGSALFDIELAHPACAGAHEWVRGHLHDTALQILEFIAGDGFGTGLSAAKISSLAGRAAHDLRRWVDSERTTVQPELLPELELITEQARTLHPRVELEIGPIGATPSSEQVEALAGAVREAVNNARKHAKASHVIVRVECDDDGRTAVTITDNGTGIDQEQVRSAAGLGVKGSIVGRMDRVGGHASLQEAPGGGTRVTLVAPRRRP